MGNGSIVIPKPPAQPLAPFVASAPQATLTVPTDAALLAQLRALNLPGVPAIIAAFKAFGDQVAYPTMLLDALVALDLPLDKRLLAHVSRLGAEAFVLDVKSDNYKKKAFLGFIDDPDNLSRGHGGQAELFLHFAVRRLGEIAELDKLPAQLRRRQMERVVHLFAFFQGELQRDFSLVGTTASVLLEYRRLLFDIVETHYQALLDDLFIAPAETSDFSAGVKQLSNHFEITTPTDVTDQTPPAIPLYRIERSRFRDYFNPVRAEFAFKMYSRKSRPVTGQGPEIAFRLVLRKRREQLALLDDLREGAHSPWEMPMPKPPKLHDNLSWQAWARAMWDTAEKNRPIVGSEDGIVVGKLDDICAYIGRYFQAFTAHVPFDLEEGSKQSNFLIRPYPRAITGCLTHDCVVYAIRWINILGQLFTPPSMPRELGEPRFAIVEMPSHVGVMIRASLYTGGQVLIAANNQNAVVTTIDATCDDECAAKVVAQEMYPGLKIAIAIREIKARPTDRRALWTEIAKLSDKKLTLPFDDPSEPFVHYLRFNAENAAIAKQLADQVGNLWRTMQEKLAGIPDPARRRSAAAKEIGPYRNALEPLFERAGKAFAAKVEPLRGKIKEILEANTTRIPKDAKVIETDPEVPHWQRAVDRYRRALAKAATPLDLSTIDPADFFPGDELPPDLGPD
jgi:hypothetical protein